MAASASATTLEIPLLPDQRSPTPRCAGIADLAWNKFVELKASNLVYDVRQVFAALVFCIHPVTNGLVIYYMIKTSNPWWASIMTCIMGAPMLTMLLLMNLNGDSRRAFVGAFGVTPTLCAIIAVSVLGAIQSIAPRGGARMQTFVKLQRLLGIGSQCLGLTFQGYIYVREKWLLDNKFKINPLLLILNISIAFYTLYKNVIYFGTYSKVASGGNRRQFFRLLTRLGDEMPSPSVLERLRTLRHAVIECDLSYVDLVGLKVLASCIATSPVLETVVFRETQLGVKGSRAWLQCCNEECDGKDWIEHFRQDFAKLLTFNRKSLRSVRFEPKIDSIDETAWDFSLAGGGLQEVKNGDVTVFSLNNSVPASPLLDAVLANDGKKTVAALEKFDRDAIKPTCPSLHVLDPTPESEGSPQMVVCDRCRNLVVRDHSCYSCCTCNYDICSDCWNQLRSFQRCIQHAALMNHLKALSAAIEAKKEHVVGDPDVLIQAAVGHSGKCVELLLESAADANSFSRLGGPPLYAAALVRSERCAAVLDLLLKHRADPNSESPKSKHSTLHAAAIMNNATAAKLLIEAGADATRLSPSQQPILNVCAYFNSADVAEILLKQRAQADVTCPEGVSPMHRAFLRQSTQTLIVLRSSADWYFKDGVGWAASDHDLHVKQVIGELREEPWRLSFATEPDEADMFFRQRACVAYLVLPESTQPGNSMWIALEGQLMEIRTPLSFKPGDKVPIHYFRVPKNWPRGCHLKVQVEGGRMVVFDRPEGAQLGQLFPFDAETGDLILANQIGALGTLAAESYSGLSLEALKPTFLWLKRRLRGLRETP